MFQDILDVHFRYNVWTTYSTVVCPVNPLFILNVPPPPYYLCTQVKPRYLRVTQVKPGYYGIRVETYIEVCGSRVRRVTYVSFLIITDGVHTPGYDLISPEGQL